MNIKRSLTIRSGVLYLRMRHYDTETGRFLTEDGHLGTLGNPMSRNLYAYGEGNPETFNSRRVYQYKHLKKLVETKEAFPELNPVSIEKQRGALFVVFAIAFCLFSMRRYMGQTDVKGQIILLIFCLVVIVFSLQSAYPFYRIWKTITEYLPFREPERLLYFGKTECVEH